jgi:hypothetical protein
MNASQESSLHETSVPSVETPKQDLAQEVYKEITSDKELCGEILSKVKWSLSIQKNGEKSGPWNPELAKERISGNLRGMVAEAVSEKIPLSDAETIYSSKNTDLGSYKTVSSQEFSNAPTNRKGDVLSHLLKKSLEEKPLQVFDPNIRDSNNPIVQQFKKERKLNNEPKVSPEEYIKLLKTYMKTQKENYNEDIIRGYTWAMIKGKNGKVDIPAGEWFGSTVIPDRLVVDGNGKLAGILEDKAYPADELAKLFSIIKEKGKQAVFYHGTAADFGKTFRGADDEPYTIGADLDKETTFADIIGALKEGASEKGADNLVVLRFPADMPDNLLNQYGEMISSYGYQNVVIQKLPFSVGELEVIAKEVVKSHWNNLLLQLGKDRNFSDRELNVLREYAGIE